MVRWNGEDIAAHADMHAANGPDPLTGLVGGGYALVRDHGSDMPVQTTVNFAGAGVVVTDDPITDATVVTIAGAVGGSGTPATSVVAETSYSQASAVGVSTNYARQDHTHGTPAASVGGATSFVTLSKWATD